MSSKDFKLFLVTSIAGSDLSLSVGDEYFCSSKEEYDRFIESGLGVKSKKDLQNVGVAKFPDVKKEQEQEQEKISSVSDPSGSDEIEKK